MGLLKLRNSLHSFNIFFIFHFDMEFIHNLQYLKDQLILFKGFVEQFFLKLFFQDEKFYELLFRSFFNLAGGFVFE